MAVVDQLGQGRARTVFAVSQNHAGLHRCDHLEPFQEVGLPRVRTEPAERVEALA